MSNNKNTKPPETNAKEGGLITEAHTSWLETHVDGFLAYCNALDAKGTGVRKLGGVKGQKKAWVLTNVWPGFVKAFELDGKDGAPLETLQRKIVKWFSNQRKNESQTVKTETTSSSTKPRATTAVEIFAKDHADAIRERIKKIREKTGRSTQEVNLDAYRGVRESMFNQLDEDELQEYEAKAAAENDRRKKKPNSEHIFGNQPHLSQNTMTVLRKLGGNDWGQHGAVVFFVQAAYQDRNDRWKTFSTTVATPGMKKADFREYLGEEVYQGTFRAPFRTFLDVSYPVTNKKSKAESTITFHANGYPQLPAIDVEATAPKVTRSIVKEYLDAVWELVRPADWSHIPTPWKAFSSPEYRKILDCAQEVEYLTALELEDVDVGRLYRNIMLCQVRGASSFELNQSLTRELLDELAGDEINSDSDILELPDEGTSGEKEDNGRNMRPSVQQSTLSNDTQQPPPPSPPQPPAGSRSPSPIDFSPVVHDVHKSLASKTATPPSDRVSMSPVGFYDDEEWQGINSPQSSLDRSPTPIDYIDSGGSRTNTPSPPLTPPHASTEATAMDGRKRKAAVQGDSSRKRLKRSPTDGHSNDSKAHQQKPPLKTATTRKGQPSSVPEEPRRSTRRTRGVAGAQPSGGATTDKATFAGTGTWKTYEVVIGRVGWILPTEVPGRLEAGVQFGDANEQQAEGDGIDGEAEDTAPILVPTRTLLYNLCGWEVKLAKDRAEGAGDNSVSAVQSQEDYVSGERKVEKRKEMEKKLEQELARTLTWPYLAMEVHKLNKKYLH